MFLKAEEESEKLSIVLQSLNEAGGEGNLASELLCFASLIVIFVAVFAAIVSQTISNFSFLQVTDHRPAFFNLSFYCFCLVFLEDSCFK